MWKTICRTIILFACVLLKQLSVSLTYSLCFLDLQMCPEDVFNHLAACQVLYVGCMVWSPVHVPLGEMQYIDSLFPPAPPRGAQACPSGDAGLEETGHPSSTAPQYSSGRAEPSGPGSSPESLWSPGSAQSCRSKNKTHTHASDMGHIMGTGTCRDCKLLNLLSRNWVG